MPRDGSGNYSLPPGTVAGSNALANSANVNSRFSDLESDANNARPVTAGGTGSTTATAARTALGVAIGTDVQAHSVGLDAIAAQVTGLTGLDVDAVTGTATADKIMEYNADGDAIGAYDFLDEDDMASDSATGLPSQQSVKAYVDGQPLTKEYQSTGQTMVAAGLLTLAHSLGAQPKIIRLYAECTTAEEGYSIGDKFDITATIARGTAGADNRGFAVTFDATNVLIRNGNSSVFANTVNASTGNAAPLSRANWDLYVEAWA